MRAQWHTKTVKIGNSYGVILPVHLLRLLKMDRKGQWVKISPSPRGNIILVEKSKKPKI